MRGALERREGWSAASARILTLAILAGCPFGEGGALPLPLAILQTALLAAVTLSLLERPLPSLPGSGWFLSLLAVLAVSGARAPYGYSAALALADCAAALAAFTLGGMFFTDSRRRLLLARVIVLSAAAQGALACAQRLLRAGGGEAVRPAGTLLNANHLAAYLAVGILIGAGLIMKGTERRKKLAGSVCVILMAIALVLTASRGGMLALCAGSLVLVVSQRGRIASLGGWKIAAGAAAAVLFVGAAAAGLAFRFQGDDPYRWDRLMLWRASVSGLAAQGPAGILLGIGPGQFGDRAAAWSPPHESLPVRFGKRLDETHSDLVRLLVEGGVAGAAVGLLGLGALALALCRALATRPADPLPFAFAAGAAALLSQALVENISERPALVLTGAAIAGSVAALASRGGSSGEVPALASRGGSSGEVPALAGGAGSEVPAPDSRRTGARGPAGVFRAVLVGSGVVAILLIVVLCPYLSDVLWRRSLLEQAGGATMLERAIWLNPFHPGYAARMSELQSAGPLAAPGFAAAVASIEEARRLDGSDARWPLQEARLWRRGFSELFHDRSSLRASARDYEAAAELAPRDPFIALDRATLAALAGEAPDAEVWFARALAIEPNFLGARLLFAKLTAEQQMPDRAREILADAEARRASTQEYSPGNDYERAILAWDEALANDVRTAISRLKSASG